MAPTKGYSLSNMEPSGLLEAPTGCQLDPGAKVMDKSAGIPLPATIGCVEEMAFGSFGGLKIFYLCYID